MNTRSKRAASTSKASSPSKVPFHRIAHALSDGVVVVDAKGKICFANPAAATLYRRSTRHLLGTEFGVPLHVGEIAEMEIVPSKGKPQTAEIKVAGITWNGRPAYLASIRDVSDRKLAERLLREIAERKRAEEQFRAAVESSPSAVIMTDSAGKMTMVSKQTQRMFGYSHKELMGQTVEMLMPERFRDQHVLKRRQYKKKPETRPMGSRQDLMCRRKDGSEFPAEIGLSLVHKGKSVSVLVNVMDITERKQLEQLREEFIRTASHELRTPMAVIREGISQILESPDGKPSHQRDILALALKNVDRLVRIVNDMLDISRMEAGRLVLSRQEVDLKGLVRGAAELFQPMARSNGLRLKITLPKTPLRLYADQDKVIQVLTNLIGNAFKFTKKGRVEVVLHQQKEQAVISVSDSGPGIAKEDLPRLFGKFQQFGESRRGAEKGSGLGLSIAKGIVELHGGSIWAQSAPRAGTTLFFTLPRMGPRELFNVHLAEALEEASKSSQKISAAVLDLPEYSKIRMKLGEKKLAEAMVQLEAVLKKGLRHPADVAIKDTRAFLILLPNTPSAEARSVLARLLADVEFRASGLSLAVPLRFASRLVTYPDDGQSHERLMDKLGL